jgi:uncharacterized protein YjbI with pentapeptide repeats
VLEGVVEGVLELEAVELEGAVDVAASVFGDAPDSDFDESDLVASDFDDSDFDDSDFGESVLEPRLSFL